MPENSQVEHNGLTWLHFSSANDENMEYLKDNYSFHDLDIEDCLSTKQRPKIDDYDNYLFIVIQLPERHSRFGFIKVSEVNIFIGNGYLITVNHKNRNLEKLFSQFKESKAMQAKYMEHGSGYLLYHIIKYLFQSTYPMLDSLGHQINKLEKEVFSETNIGNSDRLKDILIAKKDIINFRRIIIPQRNVLASLGHKHSKFLPQDLEVYFDDVVDIIETMYGTLENYRDLIVSLQETNESVISHNTNNVIKTLTIFSVIMLPLTFITGIYGMNINTLPYAQDSLSFIIIVGFMAFVVGSMLAFFKWKRWL